MLNPLFPTDDDPKDSSPPAGDEHEYVHTLKREGQRIKPLPPNVNAAANIIRQKLTKIYAEAPDAEHELAEADAAGQRPSQHQQFIESLQQSGKDLAEIQTAWHNYYVALPDDQKHAVWQEFYEAAGKTNNRPTKRSQATTKGTPASPPRTSASGVVVAEHHVEPSPQDRRTLADVRRTITRNVQTRANLKARDHLKSLGFGLAAGFIVIAIFLFSFFNEIIIAPFIQPSRHVGSAPLIVDASTASAVSSPEVIIPKINVEIPVDYSETSTNEAAIENDLESGVVHYPSTVLPGQNGNAAFFGHSSNNIFNPGKYKFAFVLLHTLVDGDTFYLTNNGKVYVYEVVDHKIVPPSDVAVLNDTEGHPATATLITCDPPGTSINRLVVTGVQISPDPSTDSAPPTTSAVTAQPAVLPGNGPSLWSRFTHWIF